MIEKNNNIKLHKYSFAIIYNIPSSGGKYILEKMYPPATALVNRMMRENM